MPIVNMDLYIPEAIQKGIDDGLIELHGGVARLAQGRKSVVHWLRQVETGPETSNPEPPKFALSDTDTQGIQKLAKNLGDMKNLDLVQIGLQVVSTALIMHKLNQIQNEISTINSNILEVLRKLDTIEYNQFLNFTKHFTRGVDRFACDDFEEALRNFQDFRSDIRHYLFGQRPEYLLARFEIVASAWKYICMAEPYEVNAAISLGRSDPGQIVEQYLKLLTDILRFLDIREKLSRIFPDTEGSMAIRNIKQYLKPSLDNILELEGNYKLQKYASMPARSTGRRLYRNCKSRILYSRGKQWSYSAIIAGIMKTSAKRLSSRQSGCSSRTRKGESCSGQPSSCPGACCRASSRTSHTPAFPAGLGGQGNHEAQ